MRYALLLTAKLTRGGWGGARAPQGAISHGADAAHAPGSLSRVGLRRSENKGMNWTRTDVFRVLRLLKPGGTVVIDSVDTDWLVKLSR